MNIHTMTSQESSRKHITSPIARLVQIGRNKSFVTFNDILKYIPDPERDIELLDRTFAALFSAGIPVHESQEDLQQEEEDQ